MKKIVLVILAVVMIFSVFTACGKKETVFISGKSDLEGSKIAVQEGTTGDLFASDIEGADIQRFKKAVDAGIELKNGKVDAVILDEQPAKKIVENNPDLVILKEEFRNEEYAIAVQKGNTELLDSINATLVRIKEDGSYDKFLAAFLVPNSEKTPLEARPESEATETVVMGTNAEFEPFEYMENENIIGFDIEIANEIANDLGKKLKIENMNFDSLISALSTGKVDMVIAGMTVTDERKESVDFSDSYYTSTQVIIIRKSSLAEK